MAREIRLGGKRANERKNKKRQVYKRSRGPFERVERERLQKLSRKLRFVDSVSENLKKKPKWQVFAVFMIPNVSGCLGLCYRTSLNEEMDGKLAGLGLELGMTLAL